MSSFRTLQVIGDPPLIPPDEIDALELTCAVCGYQSDPSLFTDVHGEIVCRDADCLVAFAEKLDDKATLLWLENRRLKARVNGVSHVS